MKTIYKFRLADDATVRMPVGAQLQRDGLVFHVFDHGEAV